jgi:hypothetical protein
LPPLGGDTEEETVALALEQPLDEMAADQPGRARHEVRQRIHVLIRESSQEKLDALIEELGPGSMESRAENRVKLLLAE